MRTAYRAKLAVLCVAATILALLLVTLMPVVWSRLVHAHPAAVSTVCAESPWAVVPTPNTGTTGDQLDGVAGIATNDVWAVGAGPKGNLIEQWNGSSWSVVTSPTVTGSARYGGLRL